MTTKKYVLRPGFTTSVNDKQQHFIPHGRLALLYGVQASECHVVYAGEEDTFPAHLIRLFPRLYGEDYVLPESEEVAA